MKVVIDTCVLVDHLWAEDESASGAIVLVKRKGYEVAVCDKLLGEYRGVLSRGSRQLYSLIDLQLLQILPKMKKYANPTVLITFGPVEDRFHLQLAIDVKAVYHVSQDKGVLAAAGDLMVAGNVVGCHPRVFVRDCGGP